MLSRRQILALTRRRCFQQTAKVTTWNALASSFNILPQKKYDFWSKNVGLFEISQLQTPEGFRVLKDEAVRRGWELLDKAVQSKPGEETIILFDELSDNLCRVADMADFVRTAHPDSGFAEAASEAHLHIGTLVEELNTNKNLYLALKRVTNNEEIMTRLDEETKTVADLFMFDFLISGIHLKSNDRQRAVQLHEEILQLTAQFLQLSNASVAFPKEQIPESLHKSFSQSDSNIVVSGLQCDNPDHLVREASYRLHYYSNPETEKILSRLLRARHEVARLVGFDSFAERALKSTMAKTPENVVKFLNLLSSKLKPMAEAEIEDLRLLKERDCEPGPIKAWDLNHYVTKSKEKKFSIDQVLFSTYFSLGDCMNGLNQLFKALYDVTVCPVPTQKGEVWSNDVIKLVVSDACGQVQGYIYCDFFNRAGKPQQDCHFTIRGGRQLRDGSYQVPIVVLMLHLSPPGLGQTPLLYPSALHNLFHEMGHAMHSMLGRTRYQHVTGTRCATDFAEVPSVLMEYFATDARVLASFAKHYKTRETLPETMIDSLCGADKTCAVTEMQTQVLYSLIDQKFHGVLSQSERSLHEVVHEVQSGHHSIPMIPNTSWHLRFSHLGSYGAKYYSYLMSRAVASRIWEKFFKENPFNKEGGLKYKNEMLRHGGGKDPVKMYQDLLGEEFNTNRLVDALIDDVTEEK
ncbi:mitochondrial intermediate peptidase-like [Clavelina lepadiformis]|uniref:Peptidase M3A/M3B catalytic domain-containing protein n=1 Tax=Clavelina lepadiformis TaxID=159417 RepID=A0ABP0GBQ1_CLALP